MISLGSKDGRKGLGLGLDMEETELEEGEACSYQNDDYSTIDPDVALSYIDEKLQDVLGHFQKDFEGGVSAENLGAKFGGYGSFLPTYQRSPVLSHPRTPAKVHNSTAISPNNLHLEGGHQNFKNPSSASLLGRHGQASETATSLPIPRALVNDSAKKDVGVSFPHCAEESSSGFDFGKSYAQPSDQKSLKVRIKVGSDNLSTQKNAEIYSGLGLDISPASSLDDIRSDSEGFSHEPQDGPNESPSSILQIMTSFPVHGNLLLSPLPHDLVYLNEKGLSEGDHKSRFLRKGGKQSSNGSDSARSDDKVSGAKKLQPFEKNAYSVDLKNLNDNKDTIGLKKQTDIETVDYEEIVASTLKLPLLSNSYSDVVNCAKGTARAVDNSRVANKVKEESCEIVSTQETGLVEKPSGKASSAGKVRADERANCNGSITVYPRKGGNIGGEKGDVSVKADSNVSKGRKTQNAEPFDPLEQKVIKKSTSREEDDKRLASGTEISSSEGKKKSKGSRSHSSQGLEVPKDSSRMDSSFVPKNRKSTYADYCLSKSEMEGEMEDSKLLQDNEKARNRYRDFFGDIELEQGEDDADSAEMPSIVRSMDSEAAEKTAFASNSMSKDILNGKRMDKSSVSETYPKPVLNAVPIDGNGSISDAGPGTSGPLVKEDWVCCDKCQKWRLLPLGTNPDSLPEKWLCSMLNWLPGMNRCSVSEDETTKALSAQYQVLAPVNQNNQQGHPGGVLPGLSLADASHFDQNCGNFGLHAVPIGGKKKNGIKDVPGPLSQVDSAQFSNSMKKNLHSAVRSTSLNGVNQSPQAKEIEPMHLSKSSVVGEHRHKQKKNKPLQQHSDGGEARSSKIKSKRDNEQDCFVTSKRIKIDGMHCTEEGWLPEHGGTLGKAGPSSSSCLSVNASGNNASGKDRYSKDGKCEAKNILQNPHTNPIDQVQVTSDDGSMHIKRLDAKDMVVQKRKTSGSEETHLKTPLLPSAYHRHDKREVLEQTSGDIHKKEKKARVSKYEGKETSVSKRSGGAAKKGRRRKDQPLGTDLGCSLTRRSLDAMDSLRKDLGSVEPSQAATSSSSKVSGSHKSKTNVQGAKSSPVESVSSSPLRFSNIDRSTSRRRSLEGKDNFGDAGLFATGTPRRCSVGEDDKGSNRSRTVRNDEPSVTHRESLESFVLDFQERDVGHLAGSEGKKQVVNRHFANGDTDPLGNGTHCPHKQRASDQCCEEERGDDKQYQANLSRSRKSGKGLSSWSKDKNRSSKSEVDNGKLKISDPGNESIDYTPSYEEKSRDGKNRVQEEFWVNSDKILVGKRGGANRVVSENNKRECQSKLGEIGSLDVKVEALSSQDQMQNLQPDCDERPSKGYLFDKTDQGEVPGRGMSNPLPPTKRGQNDTSMHSPNIHPGSQKENGGNRLLNDGPEARSKNDASEGDDALKAPKQNRKFENQNGNELIRSRHTTINGNRVRDADAPSPARRDSSNPATKALKEAKDLKHLADRLKNSGSSAEGTGLYFQAALKFLHGASLLEATSGESAKQGEMGQSMQMYSSTAKLCEFCAHEYEKSKDMAAAALAYKCMEVAYMRVIYSSRIGASRDRHELQTALKIVPLGESPSSSASDIDNLNHPSTLDKVPLAKGVNSSHLAGNHVISARNRPIARLLSFTQDINFAMEASRRSRMAFAAANVKKEETQYREGIRSVKAALDFNFQDVEGLLHLVRLAMEAIGR